MSESLTLYELVPERGAKSPGMSPYVWRTRLDLAILGMKYNIEAFNFIQISQDLPKVTGIEKTTVPIIKTPEGEFIMDSEAISQWLEERYAKTAGKSLYGEGEAGRAFVKLIEIWTKNDLVGELRPLTVPSIHSTLDAESQEYFVRTKFGEARKFKALADKNTDQKWVETQTASARKRLQLLEEHLASEKKSLKTDHVFLGGRQATHADSIVFGWYMFTRVNRKVMLDQVWTHESLPNLQQWIKSLVDTGLVKQEDLENLPRSKL